MILYSTPEFGFIDIDEKFCTGSSIMPHKKNPDSLELIRGAVSRIYANLTSVLVMMKGLPLSYNRDMQFDKSPLFDSVHLAEGALQILAKFVKTVKVNKDDIKKRLAEDETLFALDMADYLVKKGVSFTQAHDITGKIVTHAIDKRIKISRIALSELKKFSSKFEVDILDIFDAKKSVMSKRSLGSTNPLLVRQQIDILLKQVK
jgi:argininosuccinate lyase